MELNREQIVKQMQEWSDNMCENACLKGESLNGKVHTCEICFPNTVKNALSLIKELTEENERLSAEVSVKKKLLDKCVDLEDRVKADTVRKMQERLKKRASKVGNSYANGETVIIQYCISPQALDQIAKEMLEDGHR